MTARRQPTTTAVVKDEDGRRSDVQTFVLGHWEKGALQVALDALLGEFDFTGNTARVVEDLAAQETTLGSTYTAVLESLESLRSLVRGFSQSDDVTITATDWS